MCQERYDMREAFIPLWTCMECLSVCVVCVWCSVWCGVWEKHGHLAYQIRRYSFSTRV